jgi:hypothetical protein
VRGCKIIIEKGSRDGLDIGNDGKREREGK